MNLRALPLFVYLLFSATALMFVPATFAYFVDDLRAARVFLFSGTVLLTITVTIALAVLNRKPKSSGRLHLITLLFAYLILPLVCALPFSNLVPTISISQAYFEMMSSFTTTGASMFDDPSEISRTLHLWRSLVAWFGGLVILVAAVAVMEPLNLGGFEIRTGQNATGTKAERVVSSLGSSDRVIKAIRGIGPLYLLATALLGLLLVILGEDGFVAVCHAMAILSTSGISPVGGLQESTAGFWGEFVILAFFALAISHRFFSG